MSLGVQLKLQNNWTIDASVIQFQMRTTQNCVQNALENEEALSKITLEFGSRGQNVTVCTIYDKFKKFRY